MAFISVNSFCVYTFMYLYIAVLRKCVRECVMSFVVCGVIPRLFYLYAVTMVHILLVFTRGADCVCLFTRLGILNSCSPVLLSILYLVFWSAYVLF